MTSCTISVFSDTGTHWRTDPDSTSMTDLGSVGWEHVKLIHRQAQLAQVDVEVDHHIPRHRRREHFLEGKRNWTNLPYLLVLF